MSAATKVPLSRVVSKTTGGGTPERDNEEYWNGGIPWATVKDFKDGVYELKAIKEEISEKGLSRSSSHLIPAGTPIICTRMAVGRIARASFPVAINQDLRALYIREDFDTDYVVSAIDSIRHRIENVSVGSTVKGISLDQLLAFEIDAPSKPEQTKIAEILSTVDWAIEQTEALIAKQQRLKTGLMQDLLTRGIDEHGRIRSEETHEFKDSPLGRIPVEWEVTPAKELCDAVIDCKNRTPPAASEGHPVIRTPNVRGGEFVYRDLAWTDTDSYNLWVSRGKPRPGDVVITREAPFGEACQIPLDMPGACLGQRMMMYQTNAEKLRSDFLVLAIHSEAVQTRLLELAGGSTVGHIRVGDIRSLPIPHPISVEEQEKISQTLSGAGVALKDLGAQKCKLTSLKTALMQDLLNGRKRVTSLLDGKGGRDGR